MVYEYNFTVTVKIVSYAANYCLYAVIYVPDRVFAYFVSEFNISSFIHYFMICF